MVGGRGGEQQEKEWDHCPFVLSLSLYHFLLRPLPFHSFTSPHKCRNRVTAIYPKELAGIGSTSQCQHSSKVSTYGSSLMGGSKKARVGVHGYARLFTISSHYFMPG